MSEKPEPSPKVLEIKKYSNRRFYDLSHSRHLKLQEIGALIRAGHAVRVTDAQNGSNITVQVLIRIILEDNPASLDALSAPLLVSLIRNQHPPVLSPLTASPGEPKTRPGPRSETRLPEIQNPDLEELLQELKRQKT